MRVACIARYWLAAVVAGVLSLAAVTGFAHEGRQVGDYQINIGWIVEPAYEGVMNGVEIRVTRMGENAHDHGDSGAMSMSGDHHGDSMAVEGLESALRVEVTYTPTGASRVVDLSADLAEPGRYTANLLPTTPGVYTFRVFGAIEGMAVDETFASFGGGGGFDDIRPLSALQFPEELASAREMESAVRGAISTAEEARDAAEQGQGVLPVLALAAAVFGVALGAAGLVAGIRKR